MTITELSNTERMLPGAETNPLAEIAAEQFRNQIMGWVREQYSACKTARSLEERQWYVNQAFYFGRQNVQVLLSKTATGNYTLATPKAPPWRVRLVVNKIRPIIRAQVAKLTSMQPSAYVVPTSADEADISSARIAERIWEAAYRELDMKKVTKRVAWWTSIAGSGFFKIYWDPSKGPVAPIMQPDPITGQQIQVGAQPMGDACVEPVTPFHIFVPDVMEEEIENQPFVIHGMTRNPNNVRRLYGFDQEPNASATDPFMEQSFLNSIGVTNSRLLKEVPCYEVWLKPDAHSQFPNGGLVTVVGDRVVQIIQQYPYSHGQFPFAKVNDVQSEKFYGDSIINDLLPLQREYNRTRSQIIEAKNIMAKPRLMAPKGSVNPRMITSEPGQVVLYTPGFNPPTPLTMESLPPYVLEEIDRIQQDIDDISGQHEISRGQNPPQVTAASALTYLNEQDESKLSYSISSLESAIEKVARHYLTFVKDYWNEERTVKVVGKNEAFESYVWKAEDLRGNIDLRVEAGSALPQSKAARQAFLMDLFKMGAIATPEQFFEALEMRGLEKAFEDTLIDKKQAQRENQKFAELENVPPDMLLAPAPGMQEQLPGMPPTQQPLMPPELMPNSWDEHQAHIHYHNKFRKTQEFEALPDHIKAIVEQHVMLHQQALMMGVQPASGGPVIGGQQSIDPAQQMPPEQQADISTEGQY